MRKAKDFGDDFVTYHLEDELLTYDEAMKTRDVAFWKETINDEIDSIVIGDRMK